MSYGLTIPALRGKQGDRTFYLALVSNKILNNFFTINMEPESDRSQRTIDPKHAQEIANYIVENNGDYLLGAVTYAVDTEGIFNPPDGEIGTLTIPLDANLRSIDGQHRRQGLKIAIDEDPSIAEDSTAVCLYVEPDVLRRRQMFSDMNATPKVVAKALNVSFDTRDPFAQAAVRLAQEHQLLKGHVDMKAARVKATSSDFFSLAGVYDGVKRLRLGVTLPRGRSPRYDADDLYKIGGAFFDTLGEARPEFDRMKELAVLSQGDPKEFADTMQALRSVSIVYSTTTLRAIAGAFHLAMEEAGTSDPSQFKKGLASIDFAPNAELFRKTGFVSPGKSTPNARNQEVLAATYALKDELVKNS